jgi:heat shock transcription factor 1
VEKQWLEFSLIVLMEASDSQTTEKVKKPNKFLLRTYKMVSETKNHPFVSWTPDGDSLLIKDVDGFTSKVLPKFFKHKNFSSFIRQLNMYDFSKNKETDEFIYSHPHFRKGNRVNLGKIQRKLVEKNSKNSPDEDLQDKLLSIGNRQKNLMQKIEVLKNNYEEVAVHNQELLAQIHESKRREKNIHEVLMKFSNQFKEIPAFLQKFYLEQNKEIVVPVPVPLSHYLLTHQ